MKQKDLNGFRLKKVIKRSRNMRVLRDFRQFRSSTAVSGIERLFVSAILFLRIALPTYWLRTYLPDAHGPERRIRDNFIEGYCVLQTFLLVGLLMLVPPNEGLISFATVFLLAPWILSELFLVLLNIIFVGKFPELHAKPASIERSIILLLVNLIEIVLIFAIFYKHALGLPVIDSIFQATLVLGTAGYPDVCGAAQLIVVLQIFLDLIIVLLLLSAFAGEVGLFRRKDESETE